MESSEDAAARLYKDVANVQERDGKKFIQEISPKPGDKVLDLGCGTGGLTVYLAKIVGPSGTVTGVDPDASRIKLAQTTYHQVDNLTFVEGSCVKFPDMELEKYDLIFSNYVFHWVLNKEEALNVAYRSLRPGGRIALQFNTEYPPLIKKAHHELFPEFNDQLVLSFEPTQTLQQYFQNAGFDTSKIRHYTSKEYYDNLLDFCKWLKGSTPGLANVAPIDQERLDNFVAPMEDSKVVCAIPMIQIFGKK